MLIPSADPVDPRLVNRLRAAGCVFADDEARLITAQARTGPELEELVERRVSGTPLEYVLGWAGFDGLRLAITEGVFVPRRRTEFLAHRAAELAVRSDASVPVVLDLCCGCGAVAAVVARDVATAQVHAAELDPVAVACARRNLGALVHEGDLFDAVPAELRGRVDVLVANLPYVPSGELALLPPEAREHEPRRALDGGADGLAVARRVLADAVAWLAPGGRLLIETGEEQAGAAVSAFSAAGFDARVDHDTDVDGDVVATVVIGRPLSLSGDRQP